MISSWSRQRDRKGEIRRDQPQPPLRRNSPGRDAHGRRKRAARREEAHQPAILPPGRRAQERLVAPERPGRPADGRPDPRQLPVPGLTANSPLRSSSTRTRPPSGGRVRRFPARTSAWAVTMRPMNIASLIAATVLFVPGLLILYAVLVRAAGPRRRLETSLGIEALRARRANGEISEDEFEQAKRLLGG